MKPRTITKAGLLLSAALLAACAASPAADTTDEEIVSALTDALAAEGVPVENYDLQVAQVEGGYARVDVISNDPDAPGGFNAYLKLENGVWKVVVFGSGIAAEHLDELGIPQSMFPAE